MFRPRADQSRLRPRRQTPPAPAPESDLRSPKTNQWLWVFSPRQVSSKIAKHSTWIFHPLTPSLPRGEGETFAAVFEIFSVWLGRTVIRCSRTVRRCPLSSGGEHAQLPVWKDRVGLRAPAQTTFPPVGPAAHESSTHNWITHASEWPARAPTTTREGACAPRDLIPAPL